MNNKNNKGFTLIELIVVMAIIAILVLLAAPSFLNYTKDAKVTAMKQDTKVLSDAADLYHIDKNDWPADKTNDELTIAVGGVDKLYPIDENKVSSSVKNIEGDYSDYGIATAGEYEGQVFHLDGIRGRNGQKQFAYINTNIGIYTEKEIDDLIGQGYIPIASAKELDAIGKAKKQTFGKGTKWKGTYQSGLDGKYVQVTNIDLSEYSTGEGWEPIGSKANPFMGEFDGAGHEIRNLTIDRIDMPYQGLFSVTKNTFIHDVHLKNTSIKGKELTGSLIGQANRETIVEDSSAEGVVTGDSQVGGLTGGVRYGSSVENSYSASNVSGGNHVGGLAGYISDKSKVTDSYSKGDVSGMSKVGGLTGWLRDSTIERSYSSSHVVGDKYTGAFMGFIYNSSTLKDSYYNKNKSKDGFYSIGISKTTSELYQQSTYKNWDFDNTWTIEEGKGYPTLQWAGK